MSDKPYVQSRHAPPANGAGKYIMCRAEWDAIEYPHCEKMAAKLKRTHEEAMTYWKGQIEEWEKSNRALPLGVENVR